MVGSIPVKSFSYDSVQVFKLIFCPVNYTEGVCHRSESISIDHQFVPVCFFMFDLVCFGFYSGYQELNAVEILI